MAMLLLHAFTRHGSCPAHLAGMPITHWASVPSLRGRQGVHPLHRIVSGWAEGSEAPLTAVERPAAPRAVSAAHFISGVRLPPESHVLLVDDTWVQGGHAQSAALTLRAAGAAQISTLVVARWIKPGFGKNAAFLRALPDYDPTLCPWTGTHCPSGDGHAGP
ncbi:hypothetical protein [Actinomadura roseirufa]|uniref:hypothetical protein n=1 Tax=Actinomadura roseirufa TaxID=2094049 RepID=UPI001041A448|nr:hypothetical protein [Actinomadura roseirufa]